MVLRSRRRLLCRPLALAALITLGACSAGGAPATTARPGTTGPSGRSGTASGSPTGSAPGSATGGGPGATCATQVLARLSERQRVGQLLVVGVPTTSTAATATGRATAQAVDAGGYLLFGGSKQSIAQVRTLTSGVDAALAAAADGVRPFVAADQEGGQVQPLSGPGFSRMPTALAQGSWATDELRAAARVWGGQLAAAGVTLDFAPVADVVPADLGTANQPIGLYDREYGHTVDEVSGPVAAVVSGLQAAGVSATVKHFPGLGRVTGNTDVNAGVSDPVTTASDPWLQPFGAGVDAGARFVMISSASYPRLDPTHRAVFSAAVVSLLRTRFRFTGLIVSDDLGAAVQVADVPVAERGVDLLAAGGQLAVVVRPPAAATAMAAGMIAEAVADAAVRARVDGAALAVLAMKQQLGLLRCP